MKVNKALRYSVKCPHCGTKIGFTLDEVDFHVCCTDFGGYIKCPICNAKVKTHDGYWTKNEYHLLKSVEVIYESDEQTIKIEELFGLTPEGDK